MFKSGDRVVSRCNFVLNGEIVLKCGDICVVDELSFNGDIITFKNNIGSYNRTYFIGIKEARKKKLEKICSK